MSLKIVPLLRGFTEIKPLFKILEQINGVFIMGGYARYAASPRQKPDTVGDIDLFSETPEKYERLIMTLVNEMGLEIKNQNDNAVSLKVPEEGPLSLCLPIQIIKPRVVAKMRTVGTPTEVLENFDFTVTRACILSENEVLVDEDFIRDEKQHKLRFKNIHCPVSSTLRAVKYTKKGYTFPLDEALKLFLDWDSRGDEYKAKIKDFVIKSNDFKETVSKLKAKGMDDEQVKEHIESNGTGLTQEEIEQMEELMMVD